MNDSFPIFLYFPSVLWMGSVHSEKANIILFRNILYNAAIYIFNGGKLEIFHAMFI